MAKYRLLRERILASAHFEHCQMLIPSGATDEQLATCHTQDYLEKVKSGNLSDVEIRRIGFPWSKEMVVRSRRSTGASISAGQSAIREGISCNLAGGTHHSFSDSGQGYCVFNDVCVAARVLQNDGLIQRALFFDCDVHQGNGTAGITKNDSSLFSCSIHADKNYPFRKTNGDLDIALPSGCQDDQYLHALRIALERSTENFDCDIAFYLAGADPYVDDRLGLLSLTKEGLRQRDLIVIEYFQSRKIPMVIAMAGGYAPDVNDIVDIHFNTVLAAASSFQPESQ